MISRDATSLTEAPASALRWPRAPADRDSAEVVWQDLLSDPDLGEQRPVYRGFLVVSDPGRHKYGGCFVEDWRPWCIVGDDAVHSSPQHPGSARVRELRHLRPAHELVGV